METNIHFSNLTCINLSLINLADVDVTQLSKFISSLRVIDMSNCSLTQDQIQAFFRESLNSNTLQGLAISGYFEDLDEVLFIEVFSRLKIFVLSKGGCKGKEIQKIIWESLMDSTMLEDFNIQAMA